MCCWTKGNVSPRSGSGIAEIWRQKNPKNALVHAPDRAIIDKSCGRRVTGAYTVEERQIKLGELAEEGRWHDDPSPLKLRSWDGKVAASERSTCRMSMEGSTTGSRCMSSWKKHLALVGENCPIRDTRTNKLRLTQQQITAPTSEGESGNHELDLVGSDQDVGGG